MRSKQPSRQKDPVRTIEKMLQKMEEKLNADFKFTVGDYVRLLQLHEDLEGEAPRDIEVTWTDSLATSDSGK
ncbi:MAG TPA: hypothetical protein VER03_06195 [Bryobacteraceae bacterium]|nr:hypothetical protein [Bryobacteraceae bacterium]